MKQNIYDNRNFSNEYDKMRNENKGKNANDLIEIPNFRKLVPNVENKTILDLGCGYGENIRYYLEHGAKKAVGIDISSHMIDVALKENNISNAEYRIMSMEDISNIEDKFDIVISSLAFHYVEDYKKLLVDIYNLLNKGGYLIFSTEHPLVSASINNKMASNYLEIDGKWYLLVSDYNRNGIRENKWNNETVIKYHRNFSCILNSLIEVGFKVEKIEEPIATKKTIKIIPKYIHQYDRPYFLLVKASK